jgi:hypothetical protein
LEVWRPGIHDLTQRDWEVFFDLPRQPIPGPWRL